MHDHAPLLILSRRHAAKCAQIGSAMSLLALLLQLTGCAPKEAASAARSTTPGPNLTLTYPVIVYSQESLHIAVRDDAESLTSTSILRQTDLHKMGVIDANGTLYAVTESHAVPRVPNYFEDSTGNKRYRVSMQLKEVRRVDLPEAKRLLLEVVRNPKSYWNDSLDGNGVAVKTVERAASLAELTEACRNTAGWR